MLRKIFETM